MQGPEVEGLEEGEHQLLRDDGVGLEEERPLISADGFELVEVAVDGGDLLIRERLVVLGNEPLDVAHGHQGELLLLLERVVELNVAGNEGTAAAFLATDHAEVILRAAMGNHDGRDSQKALLIAVLRLDVLAQALSAF